jgi:hypothetical protein
MEHERTVLNAYIAKVGAVEVVRARSAKHTMELMREKTRVIYQVGTLNFCRNTITTLSSSIITTSCHHHNTTMTLLQQHHNATATPSQHHPNAFNTISLPLRHATGESRV